MRAYAPTGSLILGTFDSLTARGEITPDDWSRNADGTLEFEWAGGSEMFYDGQETLTHRRYRLFLDADGDAWTEDQILLAEGDAEPALPLLVPAPIQTYLVGDMATVPDLLAALEAAEGALTSFVEGNPHPDLRAVDSICDIARAAIARAKGQA